MTVNKTKYDQAAFAAQKLRALSAACPNTFHKLANTRLEISDIDAQQLSQAGYSPALGEQSGVPFISLLNIVNNILGLSSEGIGPVYFFIDDDVYHETGTYDVTDIQPNIEGCR